MQLINDRPRNRSISVCISISEADLVELYFGNLPQKVYVADAAAMKRKVQILRRVASAGKLLTKCDPFKVTDHSHCILNSIE